MRGSYLWQDWLQLCVFQGERQRTIVFCLGGGGGVIIYRMDFNKTRLLFIE